MELADRGLAGEELLLLARGRAEQGRLFGGVLDPGRLQVLPEPAVEVVSDGDLALLASLFPESENPLGALVLQIPSPQTGDRADAGPGVGQGPQKSAIAEAHDVGGVGRTEQVAGLGEGKAASLAV